ncbi:MAG: hypothetical protein R2867_42175 [Caldilineaceae bacterium]
MSTKPQGFRLSAEQMERLAQLAQVMNVSRNRAMGILIESAQVKPAVVNVGVNKNNRSVSPEKVGAAVVSA